MGLAAKGRAGRPSYGDGGAFLAGARRMKRGACGVFKTHCVSRRSLGGVRRRMGMWRPDVKPKVRAALAAMHRLIEPAHIGFRFARRLERPNLVASRTEVNAIGCLRRRGNEVHKTIAGLSLAPRPDLSATTLSKGRAGTWATSPQAEAELAKLPCAGRKKSPAQRPWRESGVRPRDRPAPAEQGERLQPDCPTAHTNGRPPGGWRPQSNLL